MLFGFLDGFHHLPHFLPISMQNRLSRWSPTSAPSSNQQDVNSVTGQRDTNFAAYKGVNVIIKEGLSEKCLTPSLQTLSPNFADLDTLQQEAVWLETAIRARISVSSRTVETS
jgi:hypothetical protein